MRTPIKILKVKSTADGSVEEVLFLPGRREAPLVVSLHSWSNSKETERKTIQEIHRRTGWSALAPEFRGPNLKTNPRVRQACASRLAKQDVLDAVDCACRRYRLNPSHLFLVGGSGGAHMALMMAGYAPQRWTAVCAWCPVTELNGKDIWASSTIPGKQHADYRAHLRACCGNNVKSRSPSGNIDRIAKATVHIFHGKKDRWLPFRTQSLAFYNQLIAKNPAAECYLRIFDGGHESHLNETLQIFRRYVQPTKAR